MLFADLHQSGPSSAVRVQHRLTYADFMQTHPELSKGKFSSNFTHKNAQQLWQKITLDLNSLIGATKSADKWRKCWTDMKCNAMTKSVVLKKSIAKTGGGSNEEDVLAPIEEKIAEIIGEVPIFGQPNTAEPTITFENYEFFVDPQNSSILQPLVNSTCENACEGKLLTADAIPIESLSSEIFESIQSPLNEFASKTIKKSKDNVIDNAINFTNQDNIFTEVPVKLSGKKSKLDVFQKSADASLQMRYVTEERNSILKSYYTAKLHILERIAIAKEKKVA